MPANNEEMLKANLPHHLKQESRSSHQLLRNTQLQLYFQKTKSDTQSAIQPPAMFFKSFECTAYYPDVKCERLHVCFRCRSCRLTLFVPGSPGSPASPLSCRLIPVTLVLKDPRCPEQDLGSLELAVTLTPKDSPVEERRDSTVLKWLHLLLVLP